MSLADGPFIDPYRLVQQAMIIRKQRMKIPITHQFAEEPPPLSSRMWKPEDIVLVEGLSLTILLSVTLLLRGVPRGRACLHMTTGKDAAALFQNGEIV